MKKMGFKNFIVHSIKCGSAISVNYSVIGLNTTEKHYSVTSYDRPHEDFYHAIRLIKECFSSMIGFPLADAETGRKLQIEIRKVVFVVSKNNGDGMRITAEITGIEEHSKPTILSTLPYYERGLQEVNTGQYTIDGCEVHVFTQQLSDRGLYAMRKLQQEAYNFAHCGKKEQPTIDEATGQIEERKEINEY